MPLITLIGYRGCGKSTVAALLAARLGCGWQDADAVLEAAAGCSIAEMIAAQGEAAFRDAEATILASTLASAAGVVATGGGVVLRAENRRLLREAFRPVVWLSASADVVRCRLAADPTTASRRPALAGGDLLDEVATTIADREPLYRECADLVIDTASTTPASVAETIVGWFQREWRP
ncbi:MAG: shikimate kinase [Planctomycetota bacterium]|jgi:shikimate kinase|nr:shikimate kinase [Planctomycetota bacterium]